MSKIGKKNIIIPPYSQKMQTHETIYTEFLQVCPSKKLQQIQLGGMDSLKKMFPICYSRFKKFSRKQVQTGVPVSMFYPPITGFFDRATILETFYKFSAPKESHFVLVVKQPDCEKYKENIRKRNRIKYKIQQ